MSTPDTQMNQYLTTIAEAVHGRDMRAAIHDGMEKTYNDSYTWFNQSLGNANQALQKATEALEIAEPMSDDIQEVKDLAEDLDTKYDETNERVNNIIAHNQDTQGNSELIDLRTTYDGQIKTSAGTAVRSQISNLHSRLNNLVREQSTGEIDDCHAKPVYVALYENQYPSSAFAAQTLQLSLPGSPAPSLAKYAFVKITFKDSNLFGAGVRSVYIPNPGKDAEATNIYTSDGHVTMPADGTYGISSYSRKFTAALSSNDTVLNIMFTDCEKIATDNPFAINNSDMTISDPSSTATTDNGYLIPYEVFLIDYVLDGEIEIDKDTELIDIRNGEDGTTYQSAGAAVRGQVVSAKNKTTSTQSMIAPLYSVSGTYAAGDYANYADKLYKAKQAISSEAWTASHWDEVNVMDEVDINVGELKSTLNDIENYPTKTKTIEITSADFVQGYRHNQPSAAIHNDSGYTTTKNVIHFKKGDIFTYPTDQGIYYFFVTTDGAFYERYVTSPYTVPEDVDLYLDCGKSGITPQTTPTVQYTKKTIIEKIVEKDESLQAQIDKFKVNFPKLEECYKQGDASVKQGYKLSNGVVVSTSTTWLCCTENFMECKTGDIFLIINCYDVARYTDSNATSYVNTVKVANLPLYSGNERWNVWVADLDGYVRFTLYWSNSIECAVTKLNLSDYPYTCVCLGDSIFGNNQKPNDLPTYMQKVDGLMTANCGFGGTEAATHFNPIYTPLSFWSIADAISTGDWTTIDVDWNAINNDHVFMANVYILCHLVDWSKVRTITVAYGTNDWNSGVNIDNANDPKDVTTYKGALRYGIEKIQSAYPHINIVLLSPLFRYWSNSSDYSTVDDDSDNRINTGRKLTDYVTAMKEVADEYHLLFFDNYNTAGINKITAPHILRDGTHLNYKYGVSMVGKHIGAEVALSNRSIDAEY